MSKLKVLVIGDLVAPTGFGRVNHSIFSRLADRLDIVGLGVNYRGDPHDLPFKVYPATGKNPNDLYGYGRVKDFVGLAPDIIFMLNDAWIVDRYLDEIIQHFSNRMPEIVVYTPVDAVDHSKEWYSRFWAVSRLVAYTQFGYDEIAGKLPKNMDKKNLSVINHGVDTSIFKPLDRIQSRRALFKTEDLDNAFIVLNMNRNQTRKRLDITMRAFADFAKDKDDAYLYMHCGDVDSSINVTQLADRLEILGKVIKTGNVRGIQTVTDSGLNLIYNCCDVGVNTSLGEGWGLGSIEHAATQAAQIVPNHSACRELFHDCGSLVSAPVPFCLDNIMTTGYLVSQESLTKRLQELYVDKDKREELALKAYKKFTGDEYNWDIIAEQWMSIFKEVTNNESSVA